MINLCQNVTTFYRQEITSLFQVQEKLRAWRNSKLSFSSSCFIAGNSHIKIISSHTVVLNENAILSFSDNVHISNYFPMKEPQNGFYSFSSTDQIGMQISKFFIALDK